MKFNLFIYCMRPDSHSSLASENYSSCISAIEFCFVTLPPFYAKVGCLVNGQAVEFLKLLTTGVFGVIGDFDVAIGLATLAPALGPSDNISSSSSSTLPSLILSMSRTPVSFFDQNFGRVFTSDLSLILSSVLSLRPPGDFWIESAPMVLLLSVLNDWFISFSSISMGVSQKLLSTGLFSGLKRKLLDLPLL